MDEEENQTEDREKLAKQKDQEILAKQTYENREFFHKLIDNLQTINVSKEVQLQSQHSTS